MTDLIFTTTWDFSYELSCHHESQNISFGEEINRALNGRQRATVAEVKSALSSFSWRTWGYSQLFHSSTVVGALCLCFYGTVSILKLGMTAPYIAVAIGVASLGISILVFVLRNGVQIQTISKHYHWLSLAADEMINEELNRFPSSQMVNLHYL